LTAASLWHLSPYLQYVTVATSSLLFLTRHAGTLIADQKIVKKGVFYKALNCKTAVKRLDNDY
jgi:hypothetical protein